MIGHGSPEWANEVPPGCLSGERRYAEGPLKGPPQPPHLRTALATSAIPPQNLRRTSGNLRRPPHGHNGTQNCRARPSVFRGNTWPARSHYR